MTTELAEFVSRRARRLCEYCRMPKSVLELPFHVDHIIAVQHRGRAIPENLAFACGRCNRFKGPNLSGIDPETNQIVRLFDPRGQRWNEHFKFAGAVIVGQSPTGRATVETLQMNHLHFLTLREEILLSGLSFDTTDPAL